MHYNLKDNSGRRLMGRVGAFLIIVRAILRRCKRQGWKRTSGNTVEIHPGRFPVIKPIDLDKSDSGRNN